MKRNTPRKGTYTYLGLPDELKATMLEKLLADSERPAQMVVNDDDHPTEIEFKDTAYKAHMVQHRKDCKETVESQDASVAFGGYEFYKGKPQEVNFAGRPAPIAEKLYAKLQSCVDQGLMAEGEPEPPKEEAPPPPPPPPPEETKTKSTRKGGSK